MKPILNKEELIPNRQYWVRSKDRKDPEIKAIYCVPWRHNSIAMSFYLSEDMGEALTAEHILTEYDILGPVPVPTHLEFMKHMVEMKADPNQGLCQEILLPGGTQQCTLTPLLHDPVTDGQRILDEVARIPSIQKLHPMYTTGRVVEEHEKGVTVNDVDVVPYVLNEAEQRPINIDMILLCLFRLDARMIIGRQVCGYTIVLSRPAGVRHSYYIHVLRTMGDSDIHTKTVNEIAKHIQSRTPECKAFDWADASSMFKMLLKLTQGHDLKNNNQ